MTRLVLLLSLLSLSALAADVNRVQGVTGGTPVITTLSGTVPLPAGAATDRTTAGAPFSLRLSDGAAFYDARSIRLLTASDVVSISGTVPVSGAFWPTLANAPLSSRLSDGTSFIDPRQMRLLTSSDVVSINGTVPVSGSFWPTAAASPLSASLSVGGAFVDPRSIRLLTSSDVVSISGTVPVSGSVNATLQTGANVIGSLSPNQSVNTAQINGVTPLMGNGATGTGSQRVTIASDNTPFPVKVDQTTPGTTNGVSLSHVGSAAVATGNGVVGTGVQRIAIASDNTAFPVNATLQTGANVVGAVNQNGTWTVQPGNTPNTTPWLVTNAQVSVANNPGACVSVTASTAVLAAFAARKKATLIPRITNTATVHIKLGATATTSNVPVEPGQSFELDGTYTGQVDAIAASGTQSVCVVEW